MWARFPVVLGIVTALLGPGTILADATRPHPRVRFAMLRERSLVVRAIDGAKQRLIHPKCQQVFTDFLDRNGNRLLANLIATGKTPAEYLDEMWFVDGTDTRICQRGDPIAAYTSAGSRVVFVCATKFRSPDLLAASDAEVLIIHELLHSLGLGENPPTSSQISSQVMRRCN